MTNVRVSVAIGLTLLIFTGCNRFDNKHAQIIEGINEGVPANVLTKQINALEKLSNGGEHDKKVLEIYQDSITAMGLMPEGLTTNMTKNYNVKHSAFRIKINRTDYAYLIRWSKGNGVGSDINPGFHLDEPRIARNADLAKTEKERLILAAILKKHPDSYEVKEEGPVQEWYFSRHFPEFLWAEAAKLY
ncbi:MAG: hypothetical protein P8J91_18780 [Pirellulaceae bacterium]|nr:hypothetical protein [Pirellulaceae bacterium]